MGRVANLLGRLRSADPAGMGLILEAADRALEAVCPARLVRSALAGSEGGLLVRGHRVQAERVFVLAFGKAALGMSRGADRAIGHLISGGLVVTDELGASPKWSDTIVGGHPTPTSASVRAGRAAIELVESLRKTDLLLALVSGGGSALLEVPAGGLDLEDLRDLNDRLLRSGAPIEIINGVRQAVSLVKAGRLARRCSGRVATLIISDVGEVPEVVASGPTVTGPHRRVDLVEVFDQYSIRGRAAERALAVTGDRVATGDRPRSDLSLMLASGATAGKAAARYLSWAGLEVRLSNEPLVGNAGEAARSALAATPDGSARVLVGETTVEVTGNGRGGRNQHAAVAAGIEIAGTPYRFLAIGTDGVDGPTDAAGGAVDGLTVSDPHLARMHLDAFDSYPYLERVGALLRTGRTGTNVADLWIVDKSG